MSDWNDWKRMKYTRSTNVNRPEIGLCCNQLNWIESDKSAILRGSRAVQDTWKSNYTAEDEKKKQTKMLHKHLSALNQSASIEDINLNWFVPKNRTLISGFDMAMAWGELWVRHKTYNKKRRGTKIQKIWTIVKINRTHVNMNEELIHRRLRTTFDPNEYFLTRQNNLESMIAMFPREPYVWNCRCVDGKRTVVYMIR